MAGTGVAAEPRSSVSRAPGYFTLLQRNRNFRRLWLGQLVSQVGDWLDYVALLTLLLTLTGSGRAVPGMLMARFQHDATVLIRFTPQNRVMPAPRHRWRGER